MVFLIVSCELQRAALGCTQLEMILNGFGTVLTTAQGQHVLAEEASTFIRAKSISSCSLQHIWECTSLHYKEILSENLIFLYSAASGIHDLSWWKPRSCQMVSIFICRNWIIEIATGIYRGFMQQKSKPDHTRKTRWARHLSSRIFSSCAAACALKRPLNGLRHWAML